MRLILPAVVLLSSLASPCLVVAATPVEAARALVVAKDPRADAAVAALLRSEPDSVDARLLQVRLLIQQRKFEDALDLADEIVDDAPENAQAHFWLGNAYGNRIGEVGMLTQARYAGNLREAYERAIALDPELDEARQYLVQFHLQAPAIVGGDVETARALQRELARRQSPRAHYARGLIAEHDDDEAAAIAAFVAAWQAAPKDPTYRMAAGIALQSGERWDEASALFTGWLAEQPGHGPALYQLGRISALSGRELPRGEASLKQYLQLPPQRGQPEAQHAWFRLGQVQARAGDTAAAKASLQQALRLDPELEEAQAELDKL